MVWCELVCAVRGLALHDRAERWTAAMERWRAGNAFGGITGRCRVHRAEVLRWRGPCAEAEDQAVLACEELSPWLRRELGWPLTELGTIRLRRGDLAGAEEAFLAAHERAWDPQPGLALLRLAQGRREAALAMITTALTHPARVPFKERPPFGALSRAPLLAAQAEIAAASGDVTTVTASATALADVAATYESTALQASALVARGRLGLLTGELDDAADALRDAAIAWGEVGAPHETAVARVLLGDVHAARGEDTRARMSWGPARATFGQLGAALWRDRVEERLSAAAEHADVVHEHVDDGRGDEGTTPSEVFRCDGDVRTVRFDDTAVLLRDLKGMRYLERMLADPGREFHVLDLVVAEHGESGRGVPTEDVDVVTRGGDAGPHLDEQARQAYRRRLREIEEDIAEADRTNDLDRRARAESDREFIVTELARATGLGGRDRRAAAAAERARSSVTRTVRYSIDRIEEHHTSLGEHLRRTVRTGLYCAYRPDPLVEVSWDV